MKTFFSLVKRNIKLFFNDKGMFLTSLITPMILLVLYATFLSNVYRQTFIENFASLFEDIDTANKQLHEQLYQDQLNYKPEPKQPVAREVYLFYSKLTKHYKIGIAKSSARRLKDFADRDVMIVTHSKKTSAALKHEQRLHKLFESYAVGHEWFDFHDDETIIQHAIEEINNIE